MQYHHVSVLVAANLRPPVSLLPGEILLYLDHKMNGLIMLTTYRLFVSYDSGATFVIMALRVIQTVERKPTLNDITILCKDGTMDM